jgi:predicted DNA-binding transcriptional regulator AlpA
VSDRKYHIDKRAETIFDGLTREKISPDQLLRTRQVAKLLAVSEAWLEQLRLNKQGPKYIKLSERSLRYKMGDILAWLQVRARSTREVA